MVWPTAPESTSVWATRKRHLLDDVKRTSWTVQAIEHVRRMRGGAQSHLMTCEDGFYYVVKLQNNPQHTRILVNDWLGTKLGTQIGLPMPVSALVNVEPWLLEHSPGLRLERYGQGHSFVPGLSFGSRYVISPVDGQIYDYLPESQTAGVRNLRDFGGALALDKWTCNADGRQVVFWKKSRDRKFTACFIDQGYCFNAAEWNYVDAPLRGVFGRNDVYKCVTGWESFEPWLSRIEHFPEDSLWALAEEIPPEWYSGDAEALENLLLKLLRRRSQVRALIVEFRESSRNPFPNWTES